MEGKEITKQTLNATLANPEQVVDFGVRMAQALMKVVSKRPGLVVNGKRYLYFDEWQILARFNGLYVRTYEAVPVKVEGSEGAKAKAEVINNKGIVVGSAEAYCLRNEAKRIKKTGEIVYPWKEKPFFQLASMAQTRAGAKALRNVLSWIAVLGGFGTTPAEEIADTDIGEDHKPNNSKATEKQIKAIYAIGHSKGMDDDILHEYVKAKAGKEHIHDLTVDEASKIIDNLQKITP